MKLDKPTIYPHNHVYESESGHFIEIDDNKGSERISVNHRTGSFFEFHPNGDLITTINNDNYQTVYGQNHSVVYGFSTITVGKNLKLLVNSSKSETTEKESYDLDIEVEEGANVNITIKKGNCNISIDNGNVEFQMKKGDMKITQGDGDFIHRVNGNYLLDVEGQMDVRVGGNQLTDVRGSRSTFIGGILDYYKMENEDAHLEIEGSKESKRMKSDIYTNSKNNVTRANENIILETVPSQEPGQIFGISGDIILNSSKNINISSSWDSSINSESNLNGNVNIYSHKSGKINIKSKNEILLSSAIDTKFDISGIFHVKTPIIKKNWQESSSPSAVSLQNYNLIFLPIYQKINYNDIMINGFKSITI